MWSTDFNPPLISETRSAFPYFASNVDTNTNKDVPYKCTECDSSLILNQSKHANSGDIRWAVSDEQSGPIVQSPSDAWQIYADI